MTRKKKMREVYWLERFRDKAALEFEILDSNREKPDILIQFDGRDVGVEITEIHIDQISNQHSDGSTLRKTHENKIDIVRRAQNLYFEEGHGWINAKFLFKELTKYSTRTYRSELARSIVDVLGQLRMDEWERCRIDSYSKPSVQRSVGVIHVLGLPKKATPHWQLADAGWSRTLQPSDIKPVIKKKNQSLYIYRKDVCENWLLIVADGFWPHGMFQIPVQDQTKWPESNFERTYIFCEPDRFLIRISEGAWAQIT